MQSCGLLRVSPRNDRVESLILLNAESHKDAVGNAKAKFM